MAVLLFSAILLSLLCMVCVHSDQCGTSVVTLVTGGRPIINGEYPWLAALYQQEQGKWEQFCGGALISPYIVLTAAHCLVSGGEVIKPENIKVGLGKIYRDFYHNEDYAVIANVMQVLVHKGFYGSLSSFALDVGLLKLSRVVDMSDYIQPACIDLDTPTTVDTGALVHVAGWGTCENGTTTDQALAADLSYLDDYACLCQIHVAYRKYVTHDKFCSLSMNGSQVDRGDSGGALTLLKNGRNFVIGVVSSKIIDQTTFSIFTDVSKPEIHYWLREKISSLKSPDYDGFLIMINEGVYKLPVGNSEGFLPPTEHLDLYFQRPVVDCVTGNLFYVSKWGKAIDQATANLTPIKTFFHIEDESSFIFDLTVDWIDRKIYWLEKTRLINPTYKLHGANMDTGIIETNLPAISRDSFTIKVHPTLRKLYVLTDRNTLECVNLDRLWTPRITLFHEEQIDVFFFFS